MFLILLIVCFNVQLKAQSSEEKHLVELARKETNSSKKLLRLIALGEYYQQHNIHLADSLKEVISNQSKGKSDFHKFKAILYVAEVSKIQGNQQAYLDNVIALKPYLEKNLTNNQKFKIHYHLWDTQSHELF